MKKITLEIYGQYIKVTSDNFFKLNMMLIHFLNRLSIWGIKKEYNRNTKRKTFKRVLEKKFFIEERQVPGITKSTFAIRLPKTLEKHLINYIFNQKDIIDKDTVDIIYKDPVKSLDGDFKFVEGITLRDYQEAYVNAIVNTNNNNMLVDLYTGYGKTMIAMNAISRIGKKFCVAILPTYIPKWIGDITELTDIKKEEILILKGNSSLLNLLEASDEELSKYKAFILSLPTFHAFIKSYLDGSLAMLGDYCPDMLFERMGIEVLLNDEGHQHFHQVVELSLFANVKFMLILTATLITHNRSLNRVYEIILPESHRLNNIVKYEPYMYAIGIAYRFDNIKKIKYRTERGYSQVKLEHSILKFPSLLRNYCGMIVDAVKEYYIKNKKKDNEKVLIYASTVKMCEAIRDALIKEYPDLKITKYTEEDPYEAILNNQIITSTIQSAGVALDIPDLITVIQTVNIDSPAANEQARGRLRRLKDNNTWFIFFWSLDVPQHKFYTRNRVDLFKGKVKELVHKKYPKEI